MYIHLSEDSLKNEDNLALIYNGLQVHGEKMMKSIHATK